MLRNTDPDRNNVITRFNRNSIGIEESCTRTLMDQGMT